MSNFLFNSYAYINDNDSDLSMISFYDDKVLIIDTNNQSTKANMSYSKFTKEYPAITLYDIDNEN